MAEIKPFTIIHEDNFIIAVNKASGISVVGERWDENAPRLDLLLKQKLAEREEPSAEYSTAELFTVHRIDKDTSGLVLFAKDQETHKRLSIAFENRNVEKTYIAVIHGRPAWPNDQAVCDLPLVPDGNKKHLTIIDQYRGKPSRTAFTLLLSAGNYSVVEARPETGRTHQIRVHLSAFEHPIVCDPLYGKLANRRTRGGKGNGVYLSSFKKNWKGNAVEERPLLERLGLHAARIVLDGLTLEAPLFRDMAVLITQMEKCGTR
jgi:RluA family pseudouridine synthase